MNYTALLISLFLIVAHYSSLTRGYYRNNLYNGKFLSSDKIERLKLICRIEIKANKIKIFVSNKIFYLNLFI